jgi:hypothetical protein
MAEKENRSMKAESRKERPNLNKRTDIVSCAKLLIGNDDGINGMDRIRIVHFFLNTRAKSMRPNTISIIVCLALALFGWLVAVPIAHA